jgi:hypothetical protein
VCEENGFDADGSRVAIVVTGVSRERTAMPITTTMISLIGPMNPWHNAPDVLRRGVEPVCGAVQIQHSSGRPY